MEVPGLQTVERAARTYQALLKLYPPAFRESYSPWMTQTFRDLCRQAYRETGQRGLVRVWLLALPDLGGSMIREHLDEFRKWKMDQENLKPGTDPRMGWAILAAALLIAAGLLAKFFVVESGGSIYTATVIAIITNLAAAALIDVVLHSGGAVTGAVSLLILVTLLPLLWVSDRAAWLSENPINAFIVTLAAIYAYPRTKKPWLIYLVAGIMALALLGISLLPD
jgi:hypothetical protein